MTPQNRKVVFNNELLLSLVFNEDTATSTVAIDVLDKENLTIVYLRLWEQNFNTRMEAWSCYQRKHKDIEELYT